MLSKMIAMASAINKSNSVKPVDFEQTGGRAGINSRIKILFKRCDVTA
jgi:hypothetical protein